jgi:glycosyltransferase involved in cell wall biosynthesis
VVGFWKEGHARSNHQPNPIQNKTKQNNPKQTIRNQTVYGSLDFDRDYVTGCRKLIKQLKLEDNVALRGLGAPLKVLSCAWIYIQTSISEGLPVAVIEAGLTGKPVVCTNVGGCMELLSNPNAGASGAPFGLEGPQPPMFGRLVAPKDAAMIAYAQLEAFGFLPSLQVCLLGFGC